MKITKEYLREVIKEEIQREFFGGLGKAIDSGVSKVGKGISAAASAVKGTAAKGARKALGSQEGKFNALYDQLAKNIKELPANIEMYAHPGMGDPQKREKDLGALVRQITSVEDQLIKALMDSGMDLTGLREGRFEDMGTKLDTSIKGGLKSARQSLGAKTDAETVKNLNDLTKATNSIVKQINFLRNNIKSGKGDQKSIDYTIKFVKSVGNKALVNIRTLRT